MQYNVDFTVVIPDDVTWVHKKAATRGLQKQTVTLTVDENNDGSARNASVVIKSADESIKKTIKIYQVFNPVYSIDVKEFTVDELSQTVKVNVTANFQFDTYPEEDWITSGGRVHKERPDFGHPRFRRRQTAARCVQDGRRKPDSGRQAD